MSYRPKTSPTHSIKAARFSFLLAECRILFISPSIFSKPWNMSIAERPAGQRDDKGGVREEDGVRAGDESGDGIGKDAARVVGVENGESAM